MITYIRTMSWYPFEYQGVLGFKKNERIDLGTSSDEAAKHFDAFVTGIVLRFVDLFTLRRF